jgi:hypothetical protein
MYRRQNSYQIRMASAYRMMKTSGDTRRCVTSGTNRCRQTPAHDSDLRQYRPAELDVCLFVHLAFVHLSAIVELQLSLAQTTRLHSSFDGDARERSMP